MKIGFFTDRFYPQVDGVAVSTDLFAHELIRQGHEVIIFCPDSPLRAKNEPSYIVRFRSFPSIWYENHRDTIPFTPAIIKKVRSYNLDIIHIQTPAQIGVLGMRIAKESNIPVVITHHTDIAQYIYVYKKIMLGILMGIVITPAIMKTPERYKELLPILKPNKSLKKWRRNLILKSVGLFYKECNLVIVPSRKMKDSLKEYGKFGNVQILPTGIDPAESKIASDFEPRSFFGITNNAPLLIFVGRLGKEKNIQLIISSMPRILAQSPTTKLLIVGDGPYHQELVELTKRHGVSGSVIFAGMLEREKVYQCLKSADIFCFASTTDTQGLVLNEAAIESLPVVFLDDQISPLAQDKITGIMSKNTHLSFSKACLKLIDNPQLAKHYGLKAKQLVLQISIQKQTQKLIKLYLELL